MSNVFLPKTSFSMRQKIEDKDVINNWNNIYNELRKASRHSPKFILQDGPPFANGKPHMGTAFNRVLKDIIIRFKQMSGFDAPFIPGWDCHGLPIEWKVEEIVRDEKKKLGESYNLKSIKNLDEIIAFRKRCRNFAEYWIDVQRNGFKSLGTIADWDNPYLTMNPKSESIVVKGILKLLSDGAVYRGYKPIMWSPVEQTALSDAEIEYKDKVSKSIYVKFPIQNTKIKGLEDCSVVIWTTTPWTIPANRAICYSNKIEYVLINTDKGKLIIAKSLLQDFSSNCSLSSIGEVRIIPGTDFDGTICRHPFYEFGYDFDVPMLPGDHVEATTGTGFVHTAPGHGLEDFAIGMKYNIKIPQIVKPEGTYYEDVPLFAGMHVYKVDDNVINYLNESGDLLAVRDITHSYPHSWRSKAPLIFRTTEQWFIDLDKTGIREKALSEIENVKWLPSKGKNRIKSFVANRSEWCISRQRAWGIPLMFFVNKKDNTVLIDDDVFKRIIDIVADEGSDAWYIRSNKDFLGSKYNEDDYEKVFDIVDVWLESGSVYAFVTLMRPELQFPADLYLEGSDQHRGWFQSSLLTSVATQSVAPYKSVLTHGFIVDESGHKMSKSLGNVIDPEDILNKYGVDVLRMWVANNDYTEDLRIGANILLQNQDLVRKFRNVIKYLIGALDGFFLEESIEYEKMDVLEKWCMARIKQVSTVIDKAIADFDIRKILDELKVFCFTELSSFYFDVRKDCLYCDPKGSFKRRGYRTVLNYLYNYLLRWLAPIMPIAADEAWSYRNTDTSIHKQRMLIISDEFIDEELIKKFEKAFKIRSVINSALEKARGEKIIGSSLEAGITLHTNDDLLFDKDYWKDFCIVSEVNIVNEPESDSFCENGISVKVFKANGDKCVRCWKYFEKLDSDNLCLRCANS